MLKFDYLMESFRNRAYSKKAFLLSTFSILEESENDKLEDVPYALMREGDKAYFKDVNGQLNYIDDYIAGTQLFNKNDPLGLTLDKPEWNITDEDLKMKTTIGRFLFNIAVMYESIGTRQAYINGETTDGKIRDIIGGLMTDNESVDNIPIPEDKASVDECLKITQQLDYLEGLNHVFVKASSVELFTIHPSIITLRDELLAKLEAEGKLDDEIAVAEVINVLVEKDAEMQYSGPTRDLFINHDFIANSRKKMFLLFDMVPNFHTGKFELLRNSLKEGWDFDHLAAYSNTAISASFDRGIGTAKGGTEFKIAVLLTNGIKGVDGDCGSTRTEEVSINKYNKKGWVGCFHLVKGEVVQIDKDDIDNLIGKPISMRVPQYCKTPDGNLCYTCLGNRLGSLKDRVSGEVSLTFTIFLLLSMKSMHVSKLSTVSTSLKEIIR